MNDELKSQLTALALDELSSDERAAIEAVLAEAPEAKAYAAETGEFCGLLTRSLAGSEEAALSDEQRTALVRQLTGLSSGPVLVVQPTPRSRSGWASWTMGLGAAAAALLVANHLWRDQEIDGVAMRATGALDTRKVASEFSGARGGAEMPLENGPVGGPVAGADQQRQVAEVGQLLNEGLGYYDLGDFGRARDSFNRVLALDPDHAAARRGLERTEKSLGNYLLASQDHNRAKMVREVDESWEAAAPEGAVASADTTAGGAIGGELADAKPVDRLAEADKANRGAAREESEGFAGGAPLAAAPKAKVDARTGGLRFGDNAISNNAIDGLMIAAEDSAAAGEPAAAAAGGASGPALLAEGTVVPESLKRESAAAATTADPLVGRVQGLAGLTGGDASAADAAPVPAAPAPAAAAEPQSSLARTDLAKAPAKPAGLPGLGEAGSQAGQPLVALSDGEGTDAFGLQPGSEARFRKMETSTLRAAATQAEEAYAEVPENPFLAVASAPLSTFSIDVDTAAYANVRRFLNQGQRPPKAAVRLEEMVNYFRYDYPQPEGDRPFSVTVDMADCPWQPQHRLARIGLQGKTVAREQRPAANLVFLVDVSGSMDEPNKLPLVRQSLHLLTSQLKGSDHVALVTYAGQSGVALPSTSLEQKETVSRAIDALTAGGSTNGASGIQLAYQQARQHFKAGGVNRVLLATDGDFNVGVTNPADLEKLITDEARSGVFLSVLGYGMGNLKDSTMEMLADKGNGNYAYIDSLSEARKALGEQLEGTLHTIAKDVKVQIEFNPAQVRHYRLLGYENRILAKEDFNDDKKDAGEIGAGHSVTALYEIVPASAPPIQPPVDPLKYQPGPAATAAPPVALDQPVSPETMTVKLRYKAPDGDTSQLIEVPVVDREQKFAEAPADFKFAASVAMTGLLLKDSAHKGTANWSMVRDLARAGKGPDPEGYRGEFLQLVEKAAGVAP